MMCNNLERALYLSLHYQFVTPLTSLVVVKPDSQRERGEFGEADRSDEFRAGHLRCFFNFFNHEKWLFEFVIKSICLGGGFLNRTGAETG